MLLPEALQGWLDLAGQVHRRADHIGVLSQCFEPIQALLGQRSPVKDQQLEG